uniref:Uncharacterized protein n=1 Tax=Euplotes crassus TaxID=5936 RepID=A0A7S3KA83_EUPCR|mmetsp:Transcript_17525/g.17273  ORF Transcript_17525/g.17273 Transcript_17525/m.17273 type:complete len:116 (+) Transcript_17525:370-717(+)|eukprot:CAMPEP_0197005656 /NCGR_PEP_ID=MMETSP1380-20130617/30571_1 /TAXON_ID=5936 /ORGANISM="Euplotes crassus, Strain CT5" /LENGTH=115 /DNA_ID=CAMNT_0042424865 /DNA_START=112 /DNA_END=459 /DNA_ORIENTATION=-
MAKVDYNDAIKGENCDERLKEKIAIKQYSEAEKWQKLEEICQEHSVDLIVKQEDKKHLKNKEPEVIYNPSPGPELKNGHHSESDKESHSEKDPRAESSDSSGDSDLMARLAELRN